MRTLASHPISSNSTPHPLKTGRACLVAVLLAAGLLSQPGSANLHGAEVIRITEFMADNFRTIPDEDGDYPDWIELHNSGADAVSLDGWYLTDSKTNPRKWRFPALTLGANSYLVVFASNKDRKQPFTPLHTNFRLSAGSGYVALVGTNGIDVVSSFDYPGQVPGVSYGVPIQDTVVPLITTNSTLRYSVPVDDRDGRGWTATDFADGGWTVAANGIGYDTDPIVSFTPVVLADSIREYTGNQGASNWFYGYWDLGNDPDGVYGPSEFRPFPKGSGALSAVNFFASNTWRWFPLAEARTEINRLGGNPTGDNGDVARLNHWVVRRWVSETNGLVRIYGTVGDASPCADPAAGDGTTFRIVINGLEVFRQTLRQRSEGYSITAQVTAGQPVDFIVEPGSARNDECDTAAFSASVATVPPTFQRIADSLIQWSISGDQGHDNWTYGNYDRGSDTVTGFQVADFKPFPEVFWNGTDYAWPAGNPPWDHVGRQTMRPTGPLSEGGEHWAIRRWISKVAGNLTVDWHVAKAVGGGNGLTARLFHKGGTAKDTITITGTNFFGTNKTVNLTGVLPGDAIDIAVEAAGVGGGGDDTADLALVDVRIFGNASLTNYLRADIRNAALNKNASVYVRIPMTLADPVAMDRLVLQLRYDAGFVAYLNGVEVLRRSAPADPVWNSAATEERLDADAGGYVTFDLSGNRDLLQSGGNVLSLHVLNSSPADPDLLSSALLSGSYLTLDASAQRYFSTPTPGSANGFGNTNLGPVVLSTRHDPVIPRPGQDLHITTTVFRTFQAVSNVVLSYRVMYGTETNVAMWDDGLHGDGAAGDGVYGATIPASAYAAGNMVRYYIRAQDVNTNATRDPVFVRRNPLPAAPEYWGTVVENPGLTNPLPVFHWFSQNASPDSPGAASIFWNGQFLDNVRFSIHGQSSSGFPKKSYNVDLNPGYKLVWKEGEPAIDDINLLTTYPDKAKMRNMLAYNTYRDAGSPYHFVVPVRVQMNGGFLGDWHFMENGDDNYLDRVGLDTRGALYKMYNTFDAPDGEKKTRKFEGSGDLSEFHAGMGLGGAARQVYMHDNLNIAGVVNYLATMTLTGNTDCCHKNYYFYRDTEGTGEWTMLPWDQDLSFGRVWSGSPTYWDDTMYTNTALRVGGNNRVPTSIFSNPLYDQMYLRRLRTLMEELLQAPGTPAHLLRYERFIDETAPTLIPDGALDLAKWGTFSGSASGGTASDNRNTQSVQQAADILKYEYLPGRRNWLFNHAEIPKSQPADPNILIGDIEFNPSSGDQDEEYFTLVNTNRVFIDVSHWRVQGAVEMTLLGGTVIPTNGTLYLTPNIRAFRARQAGPRGGQRLLVQGNYSGRLSARGEIIQLVNREGQVMSEVAYPGAPSAAQSSLRITEIMYNPAAPAAGSPYTTDDFEYLEVKNVGATTLSLAGIRFEEGIEFSFANNASAPILQPGMSGILVRNAAAFTSRHGAGRPVLGQYSGSLSDAGEKLRLVDASNEVVQDFAYDKSWHPITDGFGFSLVIVDDGAPWDAWNLRASWRPSGRFQGSPGEDDAGAAPIVPVLINEVLANAASDPLGDAIELLNPSATPANIAGWYLTDDFNTPRKYRIPANTLIAAGGYWLTREAAFNSGAVGSFGLSSTGDEIYLFSADEAGVLTGYVTGYSFGATGAGSTLGRHTNSLGDVFFIPQQANTLGALNSGPAVGPIIVSEVMYHPLETEAGDQQGDLEYIELRNITDLPVAMFHPEQPTNTWHLAGGIEFRFPGNVTIPARSSVVLVDFNPLEDLEARAAFVAAYAVPSTVLLLGPYDGKLDNSSEELALYRPGLASATVAAPDILVDWVGYADVPPWSPLADGLGASLARRPESSFGNDPASWLAAKPSPGYQESAALPPSISLQPVGGNPLRGETFSMNVSATGDEPLVYQWLHDGQPVANATRPLLVLQDLRILDWGNYEVVVMNPAGALLSSNAVVVAQQPAAIINHPQGRNVQPGSNVTFTVTASGQGRLRYQWLYNDLVIQDATNSTLIVRNVTPANEGDYRVRVTDNVGPALSAAARLAVFERPRILSQPQPVTVLAGEDASFSVLVEGRGPFGYRWQRASITRTNIVSPLHLNTFTVRGVANTTTGDYRVVITNLAGASTNSALASLRILADGDADGMADEWEVAYGLSPSSPADATTDADGDGVGNRDEYRAGTDPRDADSQLRIDRFITGLDATRIEFIARSNRTYTVEFSESVGSGNWLTLTNVMVRTEDRVESILDPYPVAAGRIYRLASPAWVSRAVPSPVILRSPLTQRVMAGSPTSLQAEASGEGAIGYQWKKDGVPVIGATGPTLSFPSIQAADQGGYSVLVTDARGSVESATGTLVVLQPPLILEQPVGGSIQVGSALRLEVHAEGQAPLQYFWIRNGDVIPGIVGPVLLINSASSADSGTYSVVIRHTTPNGVVSAETDPVEIEVR